MTRLQRTALAALALLVLVLLVAGCGGKGPAPVTTAANAGTTQGGQVATASTSATTTSASTPASSAPATTSTQFDLFSPAQHVLGQVYGSVVNIAVTAQGQAGTGIGSGVVYTSDGIILTNDHVVTLDGAVTSGQSIVVTFADNTDITATILAEDAAHDVAAIKVAKTGLKPIKFTTTGPMALGEWAIVIGSPLDFRNSVTLGIVSGLDRTLQTSAGQPPLTGLVQIDSAISPGNSGGGCFNTLGEFIGMPEVYLPPAQTGAENIGFAIPGETVHTIAVGLTGR
jgi:serine protease DegQ